MLWVGPILFQLLIVVVLVVRRLVKDFPIFFSYTFFVLGRDLVLLFLKPNSRPYAQVYFLGEPIALMLGLAVIYEVLWHLIRPYGMLRIIGLRLSWATLAVAVFFCAAMIRTLQFGRTTSWLSVLLVERSARFLQVGVLVAFILFISRLGLTWKHYTSGIVAGFGVAAGLQLFLFELKTLRAIGNDAFVLLNSAAYNCAVLIWAAYFLPRRTESHPPAQLPSSDLAHLDELLRRYLGK